MRFSMIPRFLLAIFLGSTPFAQAQTDTVPTNALDCWITTVNPRATTHYIACILDRGDLTLAPDPLDPPQILALDEIHRLLHVGALADLDRYVEEHRSKLQNEDLRQVRIFSYPSTWSWEEERPQLLARILCPDNRDCPVYIRH